MLALLRSGEHLADRTANFTVNGERHTFNIAIDLTDFGMADANGDGVNDSAFFGDRNLDNPGYSAFTLQGSVGATTGATNKPLDVWRVEQRLKYLGFPAFNALANFTGGVQGVTLTLPGYFTQPDSNPRTPLDFKVDGTFGEEEESALRAFESISNHTKGNYQLGILRTDGHPIVSSSSNLAWLNAYNAPHWMNIYESFGLSATLKADGTPKHGSAPGFKDGTDVSYEIYGTSWERDMLKAWSLSRAEQAAYGLVSADRLTLNGLSDPAYLATSDVGTKPLHIAGGHSIGLSIDLGLGEFINDDNQDSVLPGSNPDISGQLPNSTTPQWSVANAAAWSDLLPDTLGVGGVAKNGQQQALRNFLALYAVTRDDAVNGVANGNGTWDDLAKYIKNPGQNQATLKALFGDGSGMVSNVYIGGGGTTNPYKGMNLILDNLDIKAESKTMHHNHFHIDLARPDIVSLPDNLLAQDASIGQAEANPQELLAAAESMAAAIHSPYIIDQGDLTVLIMDMPDLPPQYTPIIVAEKSQAKQPNFERTIGVCKPIENDPDSRLSAVNSVSPVGAAYTYLKNVEHRKIDDAAYFAAKMTLLQAPIHGELLLDNDSGSYFSSDYNYTGSDRATVLVEIGAYKVKMMYYFELMQSVPGSGEEGSATDNKSICPNGRIWRISLNPDDPNAPVYTIQHPEQLPTPLAGLANVNIGVANLAGSALGQTVGTNITLDTNAAGYNWFIDTTPADNSEFLPTSNPNEWVAKEGSAAAGKMDMLSVLLHEYGHALGIEHSADSHDYMGTTLQAGVRRMPSAEEMALMQQLAGQVKAGLAESTALSPSPSPASGRGEFPGFPTLPLGANFIGFLGLLRSSRYGGVSIAPDASTLVTKYAVAANATLANGSLNAADGWGTQGGVDIGPSTSSGRTGGGAPAIK